MIKMNIVHCIFSLKTGGAESMLIDIVNEQVKTGNVYLIIVNNIYEPHLLNLLDGRINVVRINRTPSSRSIWPLIKLNLMLVKIHPDVIHLHNLSIAAFIFPFVFKKLYCTIHDLNIPSRFSERITEIFAISEAVALDMGSRANCPVVTIPNGINTDLIQQRTESKLCDTFKIVQVARLDASKKGQDVIIRALSILNQRGINSISLDFIGTGPSLASLETLAEELGVESKVHFLGLQDRQTIYKNLCKYDCMCHPARYEGFGLSVAEGMAAGVPVIVSNEGGPFEIINKGQYGLSFKMEDADDLADKIQFMLQNYKEILQMTESAKKYVFENYSIKRTVEDYLQEYRKG